MICKRRSSTMTLGLARNSFILSRQTSSLNTLNLAKKALHRYRKRLCLKRLLDRKVKFLLRRNMFRLSKTLRKEASYSLRYSAQTSKVCLHCRPYRLSIDLCAFCFSCICLSPFLQPLQPRYFRLRSMVACSALL